MIAIVLFTIKDSYMMGTLVEAFSDVMWVISWIVMAIALLLTVVSMLDYISKARELIGLGPSKRAKRKQSSAKSNIDGNEADPGIQRSGGSSCWATCRDGDRPCKRTRHHHRHCREPTGGLISAALTSVSGSSAVVRGGIASYATGVKTDILDVPEHVIEEFGVVSTAR